MCAKSCNFAADFVLESGKYSHRQNHHAQAQNNAKYSNTYNGPGIVKTILLNDAACYK